MRSVRSGSPSYQTRCGTCSACRAVPSPVSQPSEGGDTGCGGQYGPCSTASDGSGTLVVVETDWHNTGPVVPFQRDGSIDAKEAEYARLYWDTYSRAEKTLEGKAPH